MVEGWRDDEPIMCSYKLVHASFEVWGLQTRVEDFIQKCIRDVLLLGHRQAFAWIDEWYDMSIENVREYEKQTQNETNRKVLLANGTTSMPEVVVSSESSTELNVQQICDESDVAQIIVEDSLDMIPSTEETKCS